MRRKRYKFIRSDISVETYKRALKHKERPWARSLIERYENQEKANQRLYKFQRENLRRWTVAERAFSRLLKELGIKLIREQSFNCGNGRTYFVDFYVHTGRIGFEIDGGIHEHHESYDLERDTAIMTDYRMPIVRFTNEQVLHHQEWVKDFVMKAISERRSCAGIMKRVRRPRRYADVTVKAQREKFTAEFAPSNRPVIIAAPRSPVLSRPPKPERQYKRSGIGRSYR